MNRRLFSLETIAVALCLFAGPLQAEEGGYSFNRLVLWSEPGEQFPRLERDSATGEFTILFLGPVPETGWDPVEARRLVMRGAAFVPAEPIQILRARDPDPDWATNSTESSFDLNRDGTAEIVRARTVMIPDNRAPSDGRQRVLVEMLEGNRVLFGDLLEGPDGDSVLLHSLAAADFTRDGYPDMLVRLESGSRGGIAFYSQAPLRCAGTATLSIPGFSPSAFRSDRYGIFDLNRTPRDFFSRVPYGARAENPRCATDRQPLEKDGHGRCRYHFNSPYLGWIREFRVDFIPDREILSFDLMFPSGASALTPEQALEFLTPVLGGGYRTELRPEAEAKRQFWIWKGTRATARLLAVEQGGKIRATSLRLERN